MKVICPGMCKTGTKSMRQALDILGYENVHDIMEQKNYDYPILKKSMLGKGHATVEDFKEWYKDIDAITDVPGIFVWKEIFQAFPDAKVVLSVRDSPEQWLKSFQNMIFVDHRDVIYFKYYKAFKFLFAHRALCPQVTKYVELRDESWWRLAKADGGWNNVSPEYAKETYIKHNEEVKKNCPENQLLVFNVKEGWEPLCRFLEKDVPARPFPRNNVGHSLMKDALNDTAHYYRDSGLTQRMLNEIYRAVFVYFTGFALITSYLLGFI